MKASAIFARRLFLASAALIFSLSATAQDIPRLANGLPDFNGVWQVINEANPI